jgi:hypothetical protein
MMKEIIEKMVRQEIRDILAENEDRIREIVSASLLPELRGAIRESVMGVLGDLVEKEGALSGFTSGVDPQSSDVGPQTSDLGHPTSDLRPPQGRYLYCIAEGSERVDFGKIGIEQNEVYTIPYNDLCAVVHNCPLKPYQSQDQDIVKEWVLTHQKVVDKAWQRFATVIPIGFDTIIGGNKVSDPEENVRNWFEEDYSDLKRKLEKVRGRAEYGVQVFWDYRITAQKAAEESQEVKKLQEEIRSKPKGVAYMYRQKLEGLLKREMERLADHNFKEFYERIRSYVDDLKVEKTKKREGENREMLMNLSCLVFKDRNKELGEELEKIQALEGFFVRYTGPWPPYSFV